MGQNDIHNPHPAYPDEWLNGVKSTAELKLEAELALIKSESHFRKKVCGMESKQVVIDEVMDIEEKFKTNRKYEKREIPIIRGDYEGRFDKYFDELGFGVLRIYYEDGKACAAFFFAAGYPTDMTPADTFGSGDVQFKVDRDIINKICHGSSVTDTLNKWIKGEKDNGSK